jgi:beta-xylosidase
VRKIALLVPAGAAALVLAGAPGTATRSFTNPVFKGNFPDPFVLRVGGTYYAYGTNDIDEKVQTLRSRDLVHWRRGLDAMPSLAPWTLRGYTWAPEVLRRGDGTFVLYYTARSFDAGKQCVGRAVSRWPRGPFIDRARKPFVCQAALGGSIDPSPFRDANGDLYLLWKNDGNCCGRRTFIWAQRMSRDGLRLVGRRVRLVGNDAAWEGAVVEAPTLWQERGRYYLFFSANAYNSANYAVGYATCAGPLGPCRPSPRNPILASACRAAGPGHQAIVRDRLGRTWIVYHAWPPDKIGTVTPGRVLWLDRLEWRRAGPVVRGPTCRSQPAP